MHGKIIPIIALASALAQPLSAQQAEPLFTDESAAAFFGASPNLATESRKYAKEALEEYGGKKFAEAYAKLVVSKYFSNLAKFGKNIEPEIRAKLLASPELLDDFVSVLSPEDDAVKVYDILANIAKSSPEKFAKYPKLAIAVAVVFDTPPPKDWPHGQVSEKLLPRKLPDPVARFNQIVDMRERGKFLLPTEKMSIEELKYLVPSAATEDDAQWAQKSVSVSLSNLPKLYPSIAYDHGRLNRKQFDWNGEDYRLKTIKTKGGICVDQAYYTMEVAKARGVPAFILSGAGSDGFHAWVAYMQRPGAWNFSVGRYENARFVTGKTYDPQTWKDATDHALESLREGFRNGAKYRLSEIHCAFADVFAKQNDYEKSLACAKAAVVAEPRNADAWNKIFAYLEKLGKSEREICQNYEFAVKAFSKYPDTDAEFRRKLADLYRKNGDISAAKRLTTSIILKTKNARPDIAMEFARRELELDIQEGTAEKLLTTYKRLLGTFKNDSAVAIGGITIPIINTVLKSDKYAAARDLMKATRQVLKPSKDSLIKPTLDDIDRQLETIIPKIEADKKKSE